MMSQTTRQRPTRKARKYHIEIDITSVFIGVLFGLPLESIIATRRLSLVSACMLFVGLLIVLSQALLEFRDRDQRAELREFTEGLNS